MATYDYIIVGAGSAGCVLANRLTADKHISVLLLEVGSLDTAQEITIPGAVMQLLTSGLVWRDFTEEEPHLNNRKVYWAHGKVVGGSSSVNAMVYMRGNRGDYDRWQALGNNGWSYQDVLPYFKKAEDQERGASEYHGMGGPLHVMDRPYTNPFSQAFLEAGVEAGFSPNNDFNGASQEGIGNFQVTQQQGMRWSVARAYLHPVQNRPNLTIKADALVSRILFEGTRAVGVAYVKDGVEIQEWVHKEVIISSGAIRSPQVLLLSGVGPADQLQTFHIPVVVDLPGVGQHLQDHIHVPVSYTSKQALSLKHMPTEAELQEYRDHHDGPLTSNFVEVGGFVKTHPDLVEPDIQYHFMPIHYPEFIVGRFDQPGYTIFPALLRPQSQGRIALHSTDPTQPPAIYANYLDQPEDIQTLVEGVKLARRMGQAKAFAPFIEAETHPGPQVQSDQEIADYLRTRVTTIFHPVGSCRMGHDAMAVVDDQLRVYGTDGLRVVDASVMPTTVGGNTNAPTIMVAEKIADMMLHNGNA